MTRRPGCSDLVCAQNDVTAMREALVEHCGLSPGNITTLIDSTLSEVEDALTHLAETTFGDIIFYFSGHGQMLDERNERGRRLSGIVLRHNHLPGKRAFLTGRHLLDLVHTPNADDDSVPNAARRLVILDCCHAGGLVDPTSLPPVMWRGPHEDEVKVDNGDGEGTVVLAASVRNRTAAAGTGDTCSPYTARLVRGLSGDAYPHKHCDTGPADGGDDHVTISIMDVLKYMDRSDLHRRDEKPEQYVRVSRGDKWIVARPRRGDAEAPPTSSHTAQHMPQSVVSRASAGGLRVHPWAGAGGPGAGAGPVFEPPPGPEKQELPPGEPPNSAREAAAAAGIKAARMGAVLAARACIPGLPYIDEMPKPITGHTLAKHAVSDACSWAGAALGLAGGPVGAVAGGVVGGFVGSALSWTFGLGDP